MLLSNISYISAHHASFFKRIYTFVYNVDVIM